MKKDEHLVVVMLEPMPAGKEFEVWPMHITIVPWFPVDDSHRLDQTLVAVAAKHKPIAVKAGQVVDWGNEEKFNVLKIDDDWRLLSLHWDVLHSLEKNGFSVHQKDYLGEKYTPHITMRNSLSDPARFRRGSNIAIDRFTLISQVRLKGSGRMIKQPVRDYELG